MSQERKQGESLEELRQRAELAARFQKIPFGYNPAQVSDYMLEMRRAGERQQRESRREQELTRMEIDQLHSEIAAKNVAIESLKKQIADAERTAMTNDLLSTDTERRILEGQRALEASKRRLAECEQYIVRCEKAMEEADQLLSGNEREIERLRTALSAADERRKQYEQEHAYCEKVRAIMAELGSAAERVRGVMAENERLRAAVESRDTRITSLEDEVESLRQELERARPSAEKRASVRQAEARAMEKWEHADAPQDPFQTAYHQLANLLDKTGEGAKRPTPYLFRTHA